MVRGVVVLACGVVFVVRLCACVVLAFVFPFLSFWLGWFRHLCKSCASVCVSLCTVFAIFVYKEDYFHFYALANIRIC